MGFTGKLFMLAAFQGAMTLGAVDILHEDGSPNLGQNVPPISEQTWRSKIMVWPGKVADADLSRRAPDFFEREYGKPCVFTSDWLKDHGHCKDGSYRLENGAMAFTTGPKGFTFGFGGLPDDESKARIRLGSGWRSDVAVRLTMDIQQSVEETEWFFSNTGHDWTTTTSSKSFKVKGKGRQTFSVALFDDHGFGIEPDGFTFRCVTPGASVKLWSLGMAPYSADVHFRKTFTLPLKPILAFASFAPHPQNHDLHVNGRNVSSSAKLRRGSSKSVDIAPYLVAGKNVIAFRYGNFTDNWSGNSPEQLFEAAAVDKTGNVTRILGDASWKSSLHAAEGWTGPDFDDSAWLAPRLKDRSVSMADGKQVAGGVEPHHMGMLDATPTGRQYPVFNDDETPSFTCRLPLGVKGKLTPRLDLFKAGTDSKVETLAAPAPEVVGDFATYIFLPKVREPGPYRLIWSLLDPAGKAVETRREELVIVGPLAQDKFPLATFEEELAKRLKLVRNIDCAAPAPADSEFLDHAGMYNAKAVNKGKVAEADGLRYRETGPGAWDYFAYRLHGLERGEPYIVEVMVPDNRDRLVYSGVVETYPLNMGWNPTDGSKGWFSTTAACFTGGDFYPLSNGKRPLRYVYYPSSMSAAVVVMSGLRGNPAAACEINVYKVEGGLPALALPPTDRTFGQHSERLSTMALTMAAESPFERTSPIYYHHGHRDAWYHWYKTVERKIKWMRHQGQNMSVEGVYMYNSGDIPSLDDNVWLANQDVDITHLMLRMYAKNGIHCFLGVEYLCSPRLKYLWGDTVSDRRVQQGERCVYMVNGKGQQVDRFVDFLNPEVEKSFLDTLGWIYDRYQAAGKVDGLFMVAGSGWGPSFNALGDMTGPIGKDDVGYGDFDCALFEQETGVKLGVSPADSDRFQKRAELLKGDHQALWAQWRAEKMRAFLGKAAARLAVAKAKWPVLVYPPLSGMKPNTPFDAFTSAAATRQDRDSAMKRTFDKLNLPLDLYPAGSNVQLVTPLLDVEMFRKTRSLANTDIQAFHGWNTNPGTRQVMKRLDSLYLTSNLDEIDCPAGAAQRWLWDKTTRAAFVVRGSGDNCMHHFVDALRDHTPRNLFYCWLDCNLETAFGEQQRRFATEFYVTPEADFQPLPDADGKGVAAQSATLQDGSTWLRLVNDSPYPLSGHFTAKAQAVRDMVYDADLTHGLLDNDYQVELKPNDIRLFKLSGLAGGIKCDFAFPDAVAAATKKRAEYVLDHGKFLEGVPGDMVARLFKGLGRGDAFALHSTLDDFEVASSVKRVKAELAALAWQTRLLEDLEKTGAARIDCGSESTYRDPKGRRWLPDQKWLDCGAYGNVDGTGTDRGDALKVEGTDIPRVYQSETYGAHVIYHIPVPNGKYNVILRFAETFEQNKRAGLREFSVKVGDHLWEKKVDPFAAAGGFAKALALSEKGLQVYDGMIDIEFIGAVCVQGIEIEKAK